MKRTIGIVVLIAGIISGILFFVAGSNLSAASTNMTELRSVGGTSVAEAYYQAAGKQGLAYSTAFYACGLGIISISLGLAGLLLSGTGSDVTNRLSDSEPDAETHL
jgi:hypothetical protein